MGVARGRGQPMVVGFDLGCTHGIAGAGRGHVGRHPGCFELPPDRDDSPLVGYGVSRFRRDGSCEDAR
jgi:hypothetical protein